MIEHHDIRDTGIICGAWYLLVRVHDAVWADKHWPLDLRIAVCNKLWRLANPGMQQETVNDA